MSELRSITSLLGLFGFFISCVALIISYLTYRRQEPRLEIEVKKCIHSYKVSISNVKELKIYSLFQIFNKGDRRTRLSKVELHILIDGKNMS
jgi:hypothetical protein